MEKQLFRPKEAADFLSCGVSTIYLYHSQGKLPIRKLSARVSVIHIDDLNKLVGDKPDKNDSG